MVASAVFSGQVLSSNSFEKNTRSSGIIQMRFACTPYINGDKTASTGLKMSQFKSK